MSYRAIKVNAYFSQENFFSVFDVFFPSINVGVSVNTGSEGVVSGFLTKYRGKKKTLSEQTISRFFFIRKKIKKKFK
jgi:hypothetical protein